MQGRPGGGAQGPFVIQNLRSRPERRTAEVFPYRWDVESNLLYLAVEFCPREGYREVSNLSRESFKKIVDRLNGVRR